MDAYPLPDINLLLTQMGDSKYLTVIDAMKGFWQLKMHEDSKKYTAFSTPLGKFVWKVMPMGLHSSPSWWQYCMDKAFSEALLQYFMMYVDDGIVYSTTFDDHLKQLDHILSLSKSVGLTLSKKKCKFGYEELKLLGYVCGVDSFRMDSAKVDRILKWPTPKNQQEVRIFLGGIQYYRRLFSHFSDVTHGLNKLLKKNVKFIWDQESQQSFDECKNLLSTEPVLIHPDFSRGFVLYCDASRKAISGILSQEDKDDPNILHPIYYGSRTIVGIKKNYAVYELEMMVIVYFLKYIRYYLLGKKCKVITDHQSLKYMMTIKEDSSARVFKWLLSIMEYDIEIYYRPGSMNGNADMLSRIPLADGEEGPVPMPSVEEVITDYYLPIFNVSSEAIQSNETFHGINADRYNNLHLFLSSLSFEENIPDQEKRIIRSISRNYFINTANNRICRRSDKNYGPRLLVKNQEVSELLRKIHGHWLGGHTGITRTFINVSKEHYWPNYFDDVRSYILSCPVCQRFDTTKVPKVPMQPIPPPSGGPLSEIMIDFCTLPATENKFTQVLVIIDMFTGWVECFPAMTQQADITVIGLFECICRYSVPEKIYCDGGTHFLNKLVDTMTTTYGITVLVGPPHHSQ